MTIQSEWKWDAAALPDDLVSASEAVRVLGTSSISHLHWLADQGYVSRHQVGRVWGYQLASLHSYLGKQGKVPGPYRAKLMPVGIWRRWPADLVPCSEAAAILGVNDRWMRRLGESGAVRRWDVGADWVYSRADLEQRKRKAQPTA